MGTNGWRHWSIEGKQCLRWLLDAFKKLREKHRHSQGDECLEIANNKPVKKKKMKKKKKKRKRKKKKKK